MSDLLIANGMIACYEEKLDRLLNFTENDKNNIKKLNELSKEECDKYLFNEYKIIVCDPGKIHPITMIDENNSVYKYSACRRRYETYTKRSRTIIQTEKNKNQNIINYETELSKFNSRTLKIEDYKKFITKKNETNKKVQEFYNKQLFRKLAFRRFVKTKQSETNLINELKNKYINDTNKKLVIFIGDYGRASAMKGTLPTPNIGLKRLLSKNFDVLEVNEFNTSKLYNKTLKELTNVKVRRGKHSKHLHEILTLKEETKNRIYVNRDVNACKNILNIVKTFLTTQTRPIEFTKVIKQNKKSKKVKKEIVV